MIFIESKEVRLLIIVPMPEDSIVIEFIDKFRSRISDPFKTIVDKLETRSFDEFYKIMSNAHKDHSYNSLMIVTHGKVPTGNPCIEDKELNAIPEQYILPELNWNSWNRWYEQSLFGKLVILASCYSGQTRITSAVLQRGLATHIITPYQNKGLDVDKGPEAIACFLNNLINCDTKRYDPNTIIRAKKDMDRQFPEIINLWMYPEYKPI